MRNDHFDIKKKEHDDVLLLRNKVRVFRFVYFGHSQTAGSERSIRIRVALCRNNRPNRFLQLPGNYVMISRSCTSSHGEREMRKRTNFINKLKCFDPAKKNDGAVDIFGQREPRSLDESRHTKIVLTIMEDDKEMSTPDRQVDSVHDSRKANNINLARMLDFRRDVTIDDDVLSSGSGDNARSYDVATGVRWGNSRRGKNFSTLSLDGKGSMCGGSTQNLKGSLRESEKRNSADTVRKNLRKGSLRRTLDRISNGRSMTRETLSKDDDVDESGDASDRTKTTLLDFSDVEESAELKQSNGYHSIEKVQQPLDNEGQWLANFDQPRNTTEAAIPHSTTIAPFQPDNREGLMTLPTLRRTLSASALEPLPRSILKIGDSLAASHPQWKREKLVRFDRVEMREFDRTVGDNPSVSSGVPIGLDWKYNPNPLVKDLEDYETNRAPRRSKRELALDPSAREDMLLRDWGLTFRELNTMTIEADTIRLQRYKSAVQNPILQRRDEILEKTKRHVTRVLTGGKKREQEKLWALA